MTDSTSGEREAIVAWLREQAHKDRKAAAGSSSFAAIAMNSYALAQELAANQIERGDHLPSPPTQEN